MAWLVLLTAVRIRGRLPTFYTILKSALGPRLAEQVLDGDLPPARAVIGPEVEGDMREAGGELPLEEVHHVDAGLQREGDPAAALPADVLLRQALLREQQRRRRAA